MKTKLCKKCGETKVAGEFYKSKYYKNGLHCWCKKCAKEYKKTYYADNPEWYEKQKAVNREHRKIYYTNNPKQWEKHKVDNRKYYVDNPEQWEKKKAACRERYANDLEFQKKHKASKCTANNEIFIEALCHYSQKGDPWFLHCVCGISDVDLLTLDHVNNDGHIYNKKGRRLSGGLFTRWLRLHNWPEDIKLQILCFNCNWKKETERSRQQTAINNSKRSVEKRKYREYVNEWSRRIRLETLRHYGPKGETKCCNCGENDIDVLNFDHINGRGKRETPFEKLSGAHLAIWLKRDNWPDVPLQVLCQNCNNQKYFDALT